MALPAGFTLEQPDNSVNPIQTMGLPKGFALEQSAPVAPITTTPIAPSYKPTVFEEATGAVAEPLMKMGSSLIAKPVSEIAGIAAMFSDYLGNKGGDPSGFQKHVQESLTYEPRTTLGKSEYNPLNAIPTAMGNAMTAVGSPIKQFMKGDAADSSLRGMAANAVGEAVPQALGMAGIKNAPLIGKGVKAAGPVVGEVASDIAKNASTNAQNALVAASDKDWQRAAIIDASKVARKNNIVVNPAVTNPSFGATVSNAIVNSDYFNAAASINNAPKFNAMAREGAGIPKNVPLTAEAFKRAKDANGAAYREAANLGIIKPDAELISQIRNIEVPDLMGTSEVNAGRVKKLTDSVTSSLENGVDAAELIKTTTALRKEAKSVYDNAKKGQVDPTDRAMADAKMVIADTLDKHLELNSLPALAKRLEESRTKFAQIYSLERATNLATNQIDPMVFAREMEGKHNLTGAAAEMGQIAANLPEVSNVLAKKVGTKIQVPVRSGPAGTFGFAAGSLIGAPVATSAVSAGLASIGGKVRLKKMLSDEYQQKNAVPKDRRIQPVSEAPIASGNQIVPYVSPTEIVGDMPYRPNFTAGKVDPNPTFVGPDYQQPQIGMSQGPVGGQMGALRAEDARVRDLSMRQGRAAEAAQATAEAAIPRQPTRGGMLFDLDPITGKLRAADQGVKGATPEIFMGNTGANLKSASEKVAAGKTFDMTAAERVAWNKTQVDLKTVAPEFAKLTDKQIDLKMADRQWVQSVIDKANQKAEMFAQLEQRSQDRAAQSLARIQREKMLDVAEQLQETLGSRPSSRGYGQGPKTRAFQRGMLTGNE